MVNHFDFQARQDAMRQVEELVRKFELPVKVLTLDIVMDIFIDISPSEAKEGIAENFIDDMREYPEDLRATVVEWNNSFLFE